MLKYVEIQTNFQFEQCGRQRSVNVELSEFHFERENMNAKN